MKLDDFEEELGSFFRFLNGEQADPQASIAERGFEKQLDWRQLEEWACEHADPYIQELRHRAFDFHDQEAMDQVRLEYAWMMQRYE
ncbi:hypothetical protein ABWH93_19755 [Seohaeicola saemankumensis]|uniref:hypothetical protein n=1 Tax=Seohaeicola TaxID=481178 RepID=UPI0035D096ED